jgi:hypothetical protein
MLRPIRQCDRTFPTKELRKIMIQKLSKLTGLYIGEGLNHEGQKFEAVFNISNTHPSGLAFFYEARGNNGTVFHSENSLVGKSLSQNLSLWVLSSNHPAIIEHPLKKQETTDAGQKFIFGFGNVEDRNSFREEIHLEVLENGLRYTYHWGMPNQEFAERSGCFLKPAP